jgi:hypothetical protein
MNPHADVVAQVPIMTVGMVVAEIWPELSNRDTTMSCLPLTV